MALLQCAECYKKFSSDLSRCPECGWVPGLYDRSGGPESNVTLDAGQPVSPPARSSSDVARAGSAGLYGRNDVPESNVTLRDLRPNIILAGRYTLIEKLGSGGFGEVWKARDTVSGVPVAIKLLRSDIAGNDDEFERMRENFQKVHALHHPRIAAHLVFDRDGQNYMVVLEFVEGATLTKYWNAAWRNRPTAERVKEALRLAAQVAEGLDFAHERGVVHRDIKPDNIMVASVTKVTPQGRQTVNEAKILDFGLAADIQASMSLRGANAANDMSGTPQYMAPEQWRGRTPRSQTDQYALALIVYWQIGGRPPFTGDREILRTCSLLEQPEPLEELSEEQNAALLRALAKEPKARFATCAEFIVVMKGDGTTRQKAEAERIAAEEKARVAAVEAETARRKTAERVFVGQVVAILRGHENTVYSAAFSPGNTSATCSSVLEKRGRGT